MPIDRDRIERSPYASMAARLGDGPRAVLVLGWVEGQDLHWISADRIDMVTRRGRLVRTVGFERNLKATRLIGSDPVAAAPQDCAGPVSRAVDLDAFGRYDMLITAEVAVVERGVIEVARRRYDTLLLRESCRAAEIDWRFENYYWKDAGHGLIWKSIQHFFPATPPLELEVLKPAAA